MSNSQNNKKSKTQINFDVGAKINVNQTVGFR